MKTIAKQLKVKEFPFISKDSKGNDIYYENSNGYGVKREFDSGGNIIYYEDSKGYWEKKEFNSQGNRIYFENSKGFIKDNRNIPEYTMEELVEKIGKFKLKLEYEK